MKKTIFPLFIFIVLPFISCNNSNNDSKMIVPSAEPSYTVTINSSEGTTVMNVDATSKNVTKSTFTDTETGFVTRKEYIYDSKNELRAIDVNDDSEGLYSIKFGSLEENSSRSAIPQQEDTPKYVRSIKKTYNKEHSRNIYDEEERLEYYYDENGKLGGIFRIDGKNNVIYKGAKNDE